MRSLNLQRGDTLIEVMLATAILSVVSVSGLLLMNRGMATTQAAIEVTQVRQQVDAQVEMLRFLRDQSAEAIAVGGTSLPAQQWTVAYGRAVANDSLNPTKLGTCPADFGSQSRNRFYLTSGGPNGATVVDYPGSIAATGIAQTGAGVWVEAYPGGSATGGRSYVDFHVRACWGAVVGTNQQTLGTVVRLYATQ